MTLVPVDPKAIPVRSGRHAYCKAIKAIESFMKSEHEAVELQFEKHEYASAASVQSTYYRAIQRAKANCFVIIRKGRAYLIKGGVLDD